MRGMKTSVACVFLLLLVAGCGGNGGGGGGGSGGGGGGSGGGGGGGGSGGGGGGGGGGGSQYPAFTANDAAESHVVWPDQKRVAARDGLLHPTAPGGGHVDEYRDSAGRLTHWHYDGGTAASVIDEYFYYDSDGRLTHW